MTFVFTRRIVPFVPAGWAAALRAGAVTGEETARGVDRLYASMTLVLIVAAAMPAVTTRALTTPGSPKPAIVATAVASEGVRHQRIDMDTFRLRFAPAADLPPTIEVRHEPLLLVSHEGPPRTDEGQTVGATVSARPRSRPALLRTDVCARHGMRRVDYGKRWRCRR